MEACSEIIIIQKEMKKRSKQGHDTLRPKARSIARVECSNAIKVLSRDFPQKVERSPVGAATTKHLTVL